MVDCDVHAMMMFCLLMWLFLLVDDDDEDVRVDCDVVDCDVFMR